MKVHIVFAHESRNSNNGAHLARARRVLEDAGHEVTESDLYFKHFNCVPSRHDVKNSSADDGALTFSMAKKAFENGMLADDIVDEQKMVDAADLVIFQFPFAWFSFPAILKGWFDRVLVNGYAFTFSPLCVFDAGKFAKKKALISMTTGSYAASFSPSGLYGDFSMCLWPMLLPLRLVGFDVLPPHVSWNVCIASDEERENMLKTWEDRLRHIEQDKPLTFLPLDQFDKSQGYQLKEDVVNTIRQTDQSTPFGQHLDRAPNTNWYLGGTNKPAPY